MLKILLQHNLPIGDLSRRSKCTRYSRTSSARTSTDGGTSMPSALAVLRLITNSYLVGFWHRQVGRLLALEDAVDIACRAAVEAGHIHPVGHQAAGGDKMTVGIDRGQLVSRRQRDDVVALHAGRCANRHDQPAVRGSPKS